MSRCRQILMMSLICCGTLSCAHTYADVGECPRWSDAAVREFVQLNQDQGESPLVQQVKRLAQFCRALRQ